MVAEMKARETAIMDEMMRDVPIKRLG